MSRDNFIADMVKFFEGLHTFTKETQKLDNRMTSHFLKRHGLMSPSSSFRFCYSGCCNSLDILLEHKSKLHFYPLLTLRLFKSIEIMWARETNFLVKWSSLFLRS